jgi:hypothetical protein
VNETQALAEIKRLAAGGQVSFTHHAYERMDERNATTRDVISALMTATKATAETTSKFKVTGGVDLDRDDLNIVVALENNALVVTIF